MGEVSSKLKIVMIINAIACFIFMFLYLIIPKTYFDLVDGMVFDPYDQRAFGATLLALGIISLRAAFSDKLEQVKIMLELAILWSCAIMALNIWELIVLPISETYRVATWTDNVVLIVLIVINAYARVRKIK